MSINPSEYGLISSPLGKLPAEIHCEIWRLSLARCGTVVGSRLRFCQQVSGHSNPLALLLACKTIHRQATPKVLKANPLIIRFTSAFKPATTAEKSASLDLTNTRTTLSPALFHETQPDMVVVIQHHVYKEAIECGVVMKFNGQAARYLQTSIHHPNPRSKTLVMTISYHRWAGMYWDNETLEKLCKLDEPMTLNDCSIICFEVGLGRDDGCSETSRQGSFREQAKAAESPRQPYKACIVRAERRNLSDGLEAVGGPVLRTVSGLPAMIEGWSGTTTTITTRRSGQVTRHWLPHWAFPEEGAEDRAAV